MKHDKQNHKSYLSIVVAILIVISGCSSTSKTEDPKKELEYGKPVHVTLAWNDNIYEVSNESVPSNKIDKELGVVNKQVSPYPIQNGEVGRNTSEGPLIIGNGGGKVYAIKSVNQQEQIAFELSKGQYKMCTFFSKLK